MVSCCKLLGVRAFVLEVRSWSGHNVPVNLHQINVILSSDRKGQGPMAQLSPSEVQVRAKRRGSLRGASYPAWGCSSSTQAASSRQCPGPAKEADLSWWCPQGQVPRPCPAVITEGARHRGPTWSSGSSGHLSSGGQVPWTATLADCRCH